ncbi:MAG: TIGR00341 family protein [Rikenellaceae bacterium]
MRNETDPTSEPDIQPSQSNNEEKTFNLGESILQLQSFLVERFDLTEDQAPQEEVEQNIRRNIDFKGTNLWILMFAIVVASVGLNVNSTAVIIGAMLISPLMGPIMGVGLSLSISDFDLLKRSLRNLLFAVVVSLVVSSLYFIISPLTIAQSELLARTSPTIWDVLIATFGGLTGIVAQSRKDRSTPVIPGVAIATALMPPICTAGFGIAAGDWQYFLGALYLFSINAVFIALSGFVVARFVMKFKAHKMCNSRETNRVNRAMAVVAIVMIVPSAIMAYSIVQKTIFETNAKNYIDKVFVFDECEAINSTITYDPNGEGNKIEVVMVGEALSNDAIHMATNQLPLFSLDDTKLIVRQANKDDKVDNETFSKLLKSNAEIIDEKNNQIKELEENLARFSRDTLPTLHIAQEIGVIWTDIYSAELSRSEAITTQGESIGNHIICIVKLYKYKTLAAEDELKLKNWLLRRTGSEYIRLIVENAEIEKNIINSLIGESQTN